MVDQPIDEDDLKIDTWHNEVEATVQVIHIPSGLIAIAHGKKRLATRREAIGMIAEKLKAKMSWEKLRTWTR